MHAAPLHISWEKCRGSLDSDDDWLDENGGFQKANMVENHMFGHMNCGDIP
jgi:hypothetical protein